MIGGVATRYLGGRFTESKIQGQFDIVTGSLQPALGNNRTTSTFPGWNKPVDVFTDDSYLDRVLGFSVKLTDSISFQTIYPTSNQYLMLGAFTSVKYSSFSVSSPGTPKLLMCPGDTSWYSVYEKSTSAAYTMRIQGGYTASGSGDNIIEITFFNSARFGQTMSSYDSAIQVVTGAYTSPVTSYAKLGLCTGNSELASVAGNIFPFTTYLFLRSTTGTWSAESNSRRLKNELAYQDGLYAYN